MKPVDFQEGSFALAIDRSATECQRSSHYCLTICRSGRARDGGAARGLGDVGDADLKSPLAKLSHLERNLFRWLGFRKGRRKAPPSIDRGAGGAPLGAQWRPPMVAAFSAGSSVQDFGGEWFQWSGGSGFNRWFDQTPEMRGVVSGFQGCWLSKLFLLEVSGC